MPNVSLAELLEKIAYPKHYADDSFLIVCQIPGYNRHYVGRNSVGQPCILLGSKPDLGAFHAPVRLELLEARFGNMHKIHPAGETPREELLSVITCTTPDLQVHTYFLHICETILRIAGQQPSLHEIVQVVQRLIGLFQRLSKTASRPLNGLLGELFFIAASRNVPAAMAAWRGTDTEHFDFSIENIRVDVKTPAERLRIHHFSAEQCQPPQGTIGLLASLFIETSGGGQSLRELMSIIEKSLEGHDDLTLKLQETIARTLGSSVLSAMETRFDEQLAYTSIRFYDLSTVPAIREHIPLGVSQVHFRSDLSRIDPLNSHELQMLPLTARNFVPK